MDDPNNFLEVEVRKDAALGIMVKGEKTGTTTKKSKVNLYYFIEENNNRVFGRRRWRNPFPDRVFPTE